MRGPWPEVARPIACPQACPRPNRILPAPLAVHPNQALRQLKASASLLQGLRWQRRAAWPAQRHHADVPRLCAQAPHASRCVRHERAMRLVMRNCISRSATPMHSNARYISDTQAHAGYTPERDTRNITCTWPGTANNAPMLWKAQHAARTMASYSKSRRPPTQGGAPRSVRHLDGSTRRKSYKCGMCATNSRASCSSRMIAAQVHSCNFNDMMAQRNAASCNVCNI